VLGCAEHLPRRRWRPCRLGAAESERVEDLPDRPGAERSYHCAPRVGRADGDEGEAGGRDHAADGLIDDAVPSRRLQPRRVPAGRLLGLPDAQVPDLPAPQPLHRGETGEAYRDMPWRPGRNPHTDPDMLRLETNHAFELGRRCGSLRGPVRAGAHRPLRPRQHVLRPGSGPHRRRPRVLHGRRSRAEEGGLLRAHAAGDAAGHDDVGPTGSTFGPGVQEVVRGGRRARPRGSPADAGRGRYPHRGGMGQASRPPRPSR
jgi:hypothetical protein